MVLVTLRGCVVSSGLSGEVQDKTPDHPVRIERVGVRGVRRRITIYSPVGPLTYDVRIEAYVDLPSNMRGAHISRNVEAFLEAINEAGVGRFRSLEELFEETCRLLLEKHPYAEKAEVRGETVYYFEEEIFNTKVPEAVDVIIEVSLDRGGSVTWCVGASLYGMTVCPSAQATYSLLEGTAPNMSPSHAQRARLTLKVKTRGEMARIEWLVKAGREAFSAPAISLLKREHEHLIVKRGFERPRFVEDLVRHALYNLAVKLREEGFPGDSEVTVEGESYESIHPHNVYAYRSSSLEELLEEMEGILPLKA